MKKHPKNKTGARRTFIKTFLIMFALVLIITTPVMSIVGRTLESNPGGSEAPPLIEDLEIMFDENSPFFDAFTDAKKINILLLGVNETEGLSDTIMLICLDTEYSRIDLISIPRDTYYHRPGYDRAAEKKINAAYRKTAPVNSARAVSEILMGIPINYYVVADYAGVANIVDSMGGVPMNIPKPMKYSDPYEKPPLHIDIPAGEQVLDGHHAVQFLRCRNVYPDQDLGRVKAQQQFMKNALRQCLSLELPKIVRTVYDNLKSDITLKAAIDISRNFIGVKEDDITAFTMPGYAEPKPPYYIHPNAEEIEEMLTEIYCRDMT